MSANLNAWSRRLVQMQDCKSIAELVKRFGEPKHKVPQSGFEDWHYPLGVEKGMLHSIHVSVWPDQRFQAYMFLEPTSLRDTPQPRAWWRFWK